MTIPRHLSSFELDVYFASRDPAKPGEDATSAIARHVASCASCAAYLAELEALDAEHDLRVQRVPTLSARRFSGLRRLIAPAATLAALAAAAIVYVKSRPAVDDTDYVAAKGVPAVQVLVRSGGQTRVWDARSPVRSGDSLALRVACEQLVHVTVASPSSSGLVRLSDGPCPKTPATLPFTLVVDDQPGRERLVVVLTRTRLDDTALGEALRVNTRDAHVWVTTFEFAKEDRR